MFALGAQVANEIDIVVPSLLAGKVSSIGPGIGAVIRLSGLGRGLDSTSAETDEAILDLVATEPMVDTVAADSLEEVDPIEGLLTTREEVEGTVFDPDEDGRFVVDVEDVEDHEDNDAEGDFSTFPLFAVAASARAKGEI